MSYVRRYGGMALVVTGAILLMVSFLAGWTDVNAVQFTAFVLMVVGVIAHVQMQKRQGNY